MEEGESLSKNTEIEQALREFDEQSKSAMPQKSQKNTSLNPKVPGMVRLVMKLSHGAIKDEKQANIVLLCIVVLFMGISIFLFFNANRSGLQPPPVQELDEIKQ